MRIREEAIVKIPNAVDCDIFNTDAHHKMAEPNENTQEFILLFVGRIQRQKGIFTVLSALNNLILNNVPVRLNIIGIGQDLEKAKQYAASNKLSPFVTFLERVERSKIPDHYKQSNVVVLPSENEPFSTVYLEAMASGRPCIGLNEGGTAEIIDEGETGFLIERNDWRMLSEKLYHLFHDEDLRKKMGRNGRTKAVNCFNWDSVADRITRSYF